MVFFFVLCYLSTLFAVVVDQAHSFVCIAISPRRKKQGRKTNMKSLALLATVCASTALAAREPPARKEVKNAVFTIEVAPGETRKINEEERWELATVSVNNSSLDT